MPFTPSTATHSCGSPSFPAVLIITPPTERGLVSIGIHRSLTQYGYAFRVNEPSDYSNTEWIPRIYDKNLQFYLAKAPWHGAKESHVAKESAKLYGWVCESSMGGIMGFSSSIIRKFTFDALERLGLSLERRCGYC